MSEPPEGDHRRWRPARQLVLDLARNPSHAPDEFLVSACNEAAHAAVHRWPDWPDPVLLLVGPPGSGKSHLASIWAGMSGARDGTCVGDLLDVRDDASAVLEDCDRRRPGETELFHLLNLMREAGRTLLLTARAPPGHWGLRTPDLLSRLRLAPTVAIEAPDTALVKAVIVKLFGDRQIAIEEDVVSYAARNCERSLEAANRFVATVDEAALASGRRITRPLAARIISDLARDNA